MKFTSLWIDMDGTLMNWSKGNVRKALIEISDPKYYASLEPSSSGCYDKLLDLKKMGVSLHIISGIPDFIHCQYVPILSYAQYYKDVCKYKDYTINKFFHKLFDTVDFTMQSENKARFIKDKYNPPYPVFVEDMDVYIDQWKECINDNVLKVDEEHSCEQRLGELIRVWEI